MVEQTYRYASPSRGVRSAAGYDVALATSGGVVGLEQVEHPFFFDGFLRHPEMVAQGLLLVARVARTRFYTPPNVVAARIRAADPVVSSDGSTLRFESFSACCGGYCRLDLLAGALDEAVHLRGTTNVDFNESMRGALARVGPSDPLHLNVGEAVTATTLTEQAVEERVDLPERWIKGFAEAQLSGLGMREFARLSPAQARSFVRSLPARTAPGGPAFGVVPGPAGLRLSTRTGADAFRLGGPERLRIIEPMLRFADEVRVHAPSEPDAAPVSTWQLDLPDARLSLTLSPAASRGFSGEGGLLDVLADETASSDADLVGDLPAGPVDLVELESATGLDRTRLERALTYLAGSGRVGFDVADQAFFPRELPLVAVEAMHPRLVAARRLVERGAVRSTGGGGQVASGSATYDVRDAGRTTCTCPWFARHGLERGPCKHVLAVRLHRSGEERP